MAANSAHKEMYKIARVCLTDRVMPVRTAAAKCIEGIECFSISCFVV